MIINRIGSPIEHPVTINIKNLDVTGSHTFSILRSTVHIFGIYLRAVDFTYIFCCLLIACKKTSCAITPDLAQSHAYVWRPDDAIGVVSLCIHSCVVSERTSDTVVKPLRPDIEAVTPLELYFPTCSPDIICIHLRLACSVN